VSDFAQTIHELLKRAFLLVMVAIADAHPAGMAPDSGGQEQEAQPRRGQRGVLHSFHRDALLATEQFEPTVQIEAYEWTSCVR
jgi:hypothetical protein